MTEKKGGISADLKPGVKPPTEPPPKPADIGGPCPECDQPAGKTHLGTCSKSAMRTGTLPPPIVGGTDDLLDRARKDRAEREGVHRDYLDSWDRREADNVAGRAESFLGVSVDRDSLTKIAGSRERSLWQFVAAGRTFLGGIYWERVPGPAGNTFFIALKVWQRPGKIEWPPDDEHSRDWCPKGYFRLHVLADLADAIEHREGIDEYIATENQKPPLARPGWPDWPIDDHAARRGPQHWDWRCMDCGEPASRHAPWPVRAWRRWRS